MFIKQFFITWNKKQYYITNNCRTFILLTDNFKNNSIDIWTDQSDFVWNHIITL